jgi:NagD protein
VDTCLLYYDGACQLRLAFRPGCLGNLVLQLGFNIPLEAIFTSALATAHFLHQQRPQGSAYVVGEAGLTTALYDIGYIFTEHAPEYVVLGETVSYSFERLSTSLRLVAAGSRFIATNPDVIGPSEQGMVLACGAVAAMISAATGVKPYFVGKPNPLMMRSALRHLGMHSENAVMIGDRMDTDIIAGIESGMETILVLSGVHALTRWNGFPIGQRTSSTLWQPSNHRRHRMVWASSYRGYTLSACWTACAAASKRCC